MTLCAAVLLCSLSAPHAHAGRDKTPPTTPGNLRITSLASYAVSLEWNPSSDASGSLSYRLAISDGRELSVTKGSSSARVASGLVPGNGYTFCVYAADASGNRSRTACTSATLPADTRAPTTPVLAASYVGRDRVTLSWSASRDDGPRVSYELSMDGSALPNASAATSSSVGGLEPGTSHVFVVRAVDPYGNASTSAAITVTTLENAAVDAAAPSPPSSLSAFDDCCDEVFVSWKPSVDDRDPQASLRYEVYVDGALYEVLEGDDSLTVLVDGPGSHAIEVVAVDAAGNESGAAVTTVETTLCD